MANENQAGTKMSPDWHTLSSHEVLANLGVAENGLSSSEAKKRL